MRETTMLSYRFNAFDTLDDLQLQKEDVPRPQRGEVLVKVRAVSLNYRDISVLRGNYLHPAKVGLIPCSDAAGEIVEVGEGSRYKAGDRVINSFHPRWFGGAPPFITQPSESYGTAQDGWLTQYKVVSQEALVRLPDSLTFEQGATLPCAGTTAWSALSLGDVRAGKTVLTLGTGGVSIFSIQIAKILGAKVISLTSSERKAKILKTLGSDEVINYSQTTEWGKYIQQLTKGVGVDCVVEVGGPATVNRSLEAVRWGGNIILVGFLSEENPGIDYFHLKRSGAVLRSISVGDRFALEELVNIANMSHLKPVTSNYFDFSDAKAAFLCLQERQHVGKIIISL